MASKVRKGDTVQVLAGKDAGKRGTVHSVDPDQSKIVVSGINMIKRHMRPRGTQAQAGIIEREAPVHVSKVALVCSKCGKAARVGFEVQADGSKLRVCRKCGATIDG